MDYGILGSSDLDQSSLIPAKLTTAILIKFMYPLIHDGEFRSRILKKRLAKRMVEMPEYAKAFLDMFGGARPYITKKSVKNQFCSDLITPLPDKIDVPDTEIHIFYAKKMGAEYLARYKKHFASPVIHEQDLQHEELLVCYPEDWAKLVKCIVK